jgi:hypothetical protein
MPEQHREYTRHAEHQRKGEKVPLFAEKIYVWVPKKFHSLKTPFLNVAKFQGFNVERIWFEAAGVFFLATLQLLKL